MIWKDTKYPGYQVSFDGQVRSIDRLNSRGQRIIGKILKQTQNKNTGYYAVTLSLGARGKVRTIDVHRLVAEAFIPNVYDKPQVNHDDLCKANNSVTNLEWVTSVENMQHYHRSVSSLRKLMRSG